MSSFNEVEGMWGVDEECDEDESFALFDHAAEEVRAEPPRRAKAKKKGRRKGDRAMKSEAAAPQRLNRARAPAAPSGGVGAAETAQVRIPPFHYVHVLNVNSNVEHVVEGPRNMVPRLEERVTFGPERMLLVPPEHYCVVRHPVQRDEAGAVVEGDAGVHLRLGHCEVRLHTGTPFALYPGEVVDVNPTPLRIVEANKALRLRALDACTVAGVAHHAGHEWMFEGPAKYVPNALVSIVSEEQGRLIHPNTALRLEAVHDFTDRHGVARVTGEQWLMREAGTYVPAVEENVLEEVSGIVLTTDKALHLRALRSYVDCGGVRRRSGDEWLVTAGDREVHIPDVHEDVCGIIDITTLATTEYCVVLNPRDAASGKARLGVKEVRRGPCSFFVQPGEALEAGVQEVSVLGEDEALLLRASAAFKDDAGVAHAAGHQWMVRGPVTYCPPIEVEVLERRHKIPLAENEGIYVRDVRTGKVRVVSNTAYMLTENEVLWERRLPALVEYLLEMYAPELFVRDADAAAQAEQQRLHETMAAQQRVKAAERGKEQPKKAVSRFRPSGKMRDYTRVVRFRVPHNSACQISHFSDKTSRVVFGPALAVLGPDEHFNVLSLYGGKPKRAGAVKMLALLLGPDYITDLVTVETLDHARLQLKMSYNWKFDVDPAQPNRLFCVPDFVGDACKSISARVRGSVSAVTFDQFHRNSAKIISDSIFGEGNGTLHFEANGLNIINVDVQSIEPVDRKTRDELMKSVSLAIELTTQAQERAARQEAARLGQVARGKLERQVIRDHISAEKARSSLLQLQAESRAIQSAGASTAEAKARAEAVLIEARAEVAAAELRAQAYTLEWTEELAHETAKARAQLDFQKQRDEMEVHMARELADLEVARMQSTVGTLGRSTLVGLATASADDQDGLLSSLGIDAVLHLGGDGPLRDLLQIGGDNDRLFGRATVEDVTDEVGEEEVEEEEEGGADWDEF